MKQYIFILDNNGKGAIIPFPAGIPLPAKKLIYGTKGRPDKWYFKTERVRVEGDITATIYVEETCKLNLDDYASPVEDTPSDTSVSDSNVLDDWAPTNRKDIPVKLIYGEDNGSCSLWDITLEEYNDYRRRLDEIELEDKNGYKSKAYRDLEKEFYSHEINLRNTENDGYVPDFAVYLAKILNIDTASN